MPRRILPILSDLGGIAALAFGVLTLLHVVMP
jgi:hypothetical protein